MFFIIAYAFKGQVHVFAGQVKIVSHLSCRTSAIFKYFCPLNSILYSTYLFVGRLQIVVFTKSYYLQVVFFTKSNPLPYKLQQPWGMHSNNYGILLMW